MKPDERWKLKKYFYNWQQFRDLEWWQSVKIAAIKSGMTIGEWITRAIDDALAKAEGKE